MPNIPLERKTTSPDIHQVAELAGVSIATVSRVLNQTAKVRPATEAKVLKVIEQLGYRPNPLGQRLRKGRTEAVGMVFPTPQGQFADPFYLELLAGVGEGLNSVGLDLLVTTCPPGREELECYQRLVEQQRVDALLVARTRRQDPRITYLLKHDIPFVAHGRSRDAQTYPWLDVDGAHGFYQATQHLINLGHRRIALINAPMELNFAHHRLEGYQKALADASLEADPALLEEGNLTEEAGFRATERLLSLPWPPSAILCANDQMALGTLHALRERGLRAGQEVSVIGYDDIPMARFTDPPLSTLRQPIRSLGKRLVEMLLERLSGTKVEHLQELRLPELVLRSSVGPAVQQMV